VIGRHDELARPELTAVDCNWHIDPPTGPLRCLAQIRYNSPAAAATAELVDDRLTVRFDEPRHGVAAGQAVVLYHGERVLGGGWSE
jgi:tRNA-specific 2-thiouridylase